MRTPSYMVFALSVMVASCREAPVSETEAGAPEPGPSASDPAVLIGAGDVTNCLDSRDEETASLLDSLDGAVFTAGDNIHRFLVEDASYDCYEATWGRHKARTYATIGNQDYDDAGSADSYFEYFGEWAGPAGKGYYSFDLGAWHVIVLNSNAEHVATHPGSAQEQWLRADLAANQDKNCTLAIWHHPRFYQGANWNKNSDVAPFWNALYEAGADVVVNGHFHLYERYAPQTPDGAPDPDRGIRQFTVGTAGNPLDAPHPPAPNVEIRDYTSVGVLKLTLEVGRYSWEFIPVPGDTFSDSGTANCH